MQRLGSLSYLLSWMGGYEMVGMTVWASSLFVVAAVWVSQNVWKPPCSDSPNPHSGASEESRPDTT